MANAKSLSSDQTVPPKVPRLASLLHRVSHAKDAEGHSAELLDELMFLLDDPPPGTSDRWQAGADLCAAHNIATSRMSVWRLYRSHIIQWRREQNPEPLEPPSAKEMARLQEQLRFIAIQRLAEMLNNPQLSAKELIGIFRGDLRLQQVQLACDKFEHRRRRDQRRDDREHEAEAFSDALKMASIKKYLENKPKSPPPPSIPPHTTS